MDGDGFEGRMARGKPHKHPRDRPKRGRGGNVQKRTQRAPELAQQQFRELPDADAGDQSSSGGSALDMEELLMRLDVGAELEELTTQHAQRPETSGRIKEESVLQSAYGAEFARLESLLCTAPLHHLVGLPYNQCFILGLSREQELELGIMDEGAAWNALHQLSAKAGRDDDHSSKGAGKDQSPGQIPTAEDVSVQMLDDNKNPDRYPDDFDAWLDDLAA